MYEIAEPNSGAPIAMLDLAWPNGLQEGLSQPVAVLLNEETEVHALANSHGFRYFTTVDEFKQYVLKEIIGAEDDGIAIDTAKESKQDTLIFTAHGNERFHLGSLRHQVWEHLNVNGPTKNQEIALATGIDIKAVRDCTWKLCADGKAFGEPCN